MFPLATRYAINHNSLNSIQLSYAVHTFERFGGFLQCAAQVLRVDAQIVHELIA